MLNTYIILALRELGLHSKTVSQRWKKKKHYKESVYAQDIETHLLILQSLKY
jgi:hypothetical protein